MPARPRQIIKKESRPIHWSRTILALGVGLFLVAAMVMIMRPSLKVFSVAVAGGDGNIDVYVIDMSKGSIVSVQVPNETEVELGMNRGKLRAGSVWRLVKSENLPGQILADTTMRTFHFPVDYWAEESALYNALNPQTDMPFGLKMRLGLLLRTKPITKINLSETSYLVRGTLTDGEIGWLVSESVPLALASLFTDYQISEGSTVINILNNTGEGQYRLEDVVSTLEILGGKVAPISQRGKLSGVCRVSAKDENTRIRIASVFNCEIATEAPEAFDAELELGDQFLERF